MVGSSSTARRLGQQTDGTKVGLPSKCGFRKAVGSPNGDCWVSHGFGVGGWINESMAIPGTDLLEVPTIYEAYIRPMYGNIPQKYGLIWYSTSFLGSWNSH